MIGSLSGVLREKNPPGVLLECGGVGYEVQVPMSTFYQLPEVGAPLSLLTHLVVREDAQLLYGFASAAERRAFRALIRVSGVGPRMALSVLSSLEVAELEQAVARQEVARLIKVPGIGRKTAERLLLELKGKLLVPGADASPATARTADSGTDDIIEALLALGWAAKEASSARAKLPPDVDVGEGIRLALRALGR